MRKLAETLGRDWRESSRLLPSPFKQKGFVLVVAVIVMSVLLMVAVPFISKLSGQFRSTQRSYKSLTALNLAEAGVERAIWELSFGDVSSWEGDSNQRSLTLTDVQASSGEVVGDIVVTVSNPDSQTPVIESTGRIPYSGGLTVDKTIRVVLSKVEAIILDYAAFSQEEIHLLGNVTIDSYDSREGLYGDPNVGSEGHVGTNSAQQDRIKLVDTSTIYGNAYSGPDSDPEVVIRVGPGAHIYGEKLALSEMRNLPLITPPADLAARGDFSLPVGGQAVISESGEYSGLTLGNNAKLTVTGDITLSVVDGINIGVGAVLELTAGSRLRMYAGTSFTQSVESAINNAAKDPTRLLIIGTETLKSLEWKSNTSFWGAVYAPGAAVSLKSGVDFYGAVVGDEVKLHDLSRLHYDVALEKMNMLTSSYVLYEMKSWQERPN